MLMKSSRIGVDSHRVILPGLDDFFNCERCGWRRRVKVARRLYKERPGKYAVFGRP
jgi:RNase P subunit RPR2